MFTRRQHCAILATAFLSAAACWGQSRKSPHETVSATLEGKNITISYGRPSLKGRKAVGGALVPYGQVWRTGADEATKLTTDADLMIGDLKVPAGSYSLFTLPEQGGKWTLIVNKVADQWGAFKYQESDDLGRTPLTVEQASSPVEQFTIAFEETKGDSTTVAMAWESVKLSTKVRLAK